MEVFHLKNGDLSQFFTTDEENTFLEHGYSADSDNQRKENAKAPSLGRDRKNKLTGDQTGDYHNDAAGNGNIKIKQEAVGGLPGKAWQQEYIGGKGEVGENVVLSPGVKITGNCKVGDNVLFGSNSALIPGTKIQSGAEVGIGAIPKRLVKSGKFVKAPVGDVIDLSLLRSDIL